MTTREIPVICHDYKTGQTKEETYTAKIDTHHLIPARPTDTTHHIQTPTNGNSDSDSLRHVDIRCGRGNTLAGIPDKTREDNRQLIADTSVLPYPWIAYAVATIPGIGDVRATAFMVGPSQLVTCAHAVYKTANDSIDAWNSITVYPGQTRDNNGVLLRPFSASVTKAWISVPWYKYRFDKDERPCNEDWAVLEVGDPTDPRPALGEKTGYFGLFRSDYELVGNTVRYTGYPYMVHKVETDAMWSGTGLIDEYYTEGHCQA